MSNVTKEEVLEMALHAERQALMLSHFPDAQLPWLKTAQVFHAYAKIIDHLQRLESFASWWAKNDLSMPPDPISIAGILRDQAEEIEWVQITWYE